MKSTQRPFLPAIFCDRSLPVFQPQRWQLVGFAIGLTLSLSSAFLPQVGRTATPETAPAALKQTLAQIDAAANRRNVQEVLAFYSPNFTHSDGLTRQTLEKALTQIWQSYPNLSYRTELKSWQAEGTAIVAETVTQITGTRTTENREYKLNATMTARQRFENQKIVNQEILAERSKITSGSNPPTLKLSLPEQVTVGQEFSLDAIVEEPLGKDLLLGTALEEPIKVDGYTNPTTANLQLLNAGGIFRIGRAPNTPEDRWISAVVVRHNGMTMLTQRLQVVDRKK